MHTLAGSFMLLLLLLFLLLPSCFWFFLVSLSFSVNFLSPARGYLPAKVDGWAFTLFCNLHSDTGGGGL